MIIADEFGFKKREKGLGCLTGDPEKIDYSPAIDSFDQILLQKGDENVEVRDVHKDSCLGYRGTIHGFTKSFTTTSEGMKIGQEICFSEEHVFSAQNF